MNEPPAFLATETGVRQIAENTVAGVNIGGRVAATDQDGDSLTYSLGGTDAMSFEFDASNGQLKTKAPLDHETTASYTVTISVRDSRAADGTSDTATDATITVTVSVTDVAEDGTVTLFPRQNSKCELLPAELIVRWLLPLRLLLAASWKAQT